jgi:hypothetical protein
LRSYFALNPTLKVPSPFQPKADPPLAEMGEGWGEGDHHPTDERNLATTLPLTPSHREAVSEVILPLCKTDYEGVESAFNRSTLPNPPPPQNVGGQAYKGRERLRKQPHRGRENIMGKQVSDT